MCRIIHLIESLVLLILVNIVVCLLFCFSSSAFRHIFKVKGIKGPQKFLIIGKELHAKTIGNLALAVQNKTWALHNKCRKSGLDLYNWPFAVLMILWEPKNYCPIVIFVSSNYRGFISNRETK